MTVMDRNAGNWMPKVLGEGKISKLSKRFAFVEADGNLGQIYVGLDSTLPFFPDCKDMKDCYQLGDTVVFTAQKQSGSSSSTSGGGGSSTQHSDCTLSAYAIMPKNQLLDAEGTIKEISNKYCYAVSKKYGRIFIPFSAKNEYGHPWMGRNACSERKIKLKIMPQPELRECKYVAYMVHGGDPPPPPHILHCSSNSASFDNGVGGGMGHHNSSSVATSHNQLVNSNSLPAYQYVSGRVARQPNSVNQLLGIVITVDETSVERLAYSAQAGLVRIPPNCTLPAEELHAGNFIIFDAIKFRETSRDRSIDVAWLATSIEPLGELVSIDQDFQSRFPPYDEPRLTLEVQAIILRVSSTSNSAWLWNDLIGRIYVNNHSFRGGMKVMDAVDCTCQYTGHYEDVAWTAINLKVLGKNESKAVHDEFGQLLVTDDRWKVIHMNETGANTPAGSTGGQPSNNGSSKLSFYGFLSHMENGSSAFLTWTDVNSGDAPPARDEMCRVTAFHQHRDTKNQWRAVLVSPLSAHTKQPIYSHPKMETKGKLAPKYANRKRRGKWTMASGAETVCLRSLAVAASKPAPGVIGEGLHKHQRQGSVGSAAAAAKNAVLTTLTKKASDTTSVACPPSVWGLITVNPKSKFDMFNEDVQRSFSADRLLLSNGGVGGVIKTRDSSTSHSGSNSKRCSNSASEGEDGQDIASPPVSPPGFSDSVGWNRTLKLISNDSSESNSQPDAPYEFDANQHEFFSTGADSQLGPMQNLDSLKALETPPHSASISKKLTTVKDIWGTSPFESHHPASSPWGMDTVLEELGAGSRETKKKHGSGDNTASAALLKLNIDCGNGGSGRGTQFGLLRVPVKDAGTQSESDFADVFAKAIRSDPEGFKHIIRGRENELTDWIFNQKTMLANNNNSTHTPASSSAPSPVPSSTSPAPLPTASINGHSNHHHYHHHSSLVSTAGKQA